MKTIRNILLANVLFISLSGLCGAMSTCKKPVYDINGYYDGCYDVINGCCLDTWKVYMGSVMVQMSYGVQSHDFYEAFVFVGKGCCGSPTRKLLLYPEDNVVITHFGLKIGSVLTVVNPSGMGSNTISFKVVGNNWARYDSDFEHRRMMIMTVELKVVKK